MDDKSKKIKAPMSLSPFVYGVAFIVMIVLMIICLTPKASNTENIFGYDVYEARHIETPLPHPASSTMISDTESMVKFSDKNGAVTILITNLDNNQLLFQAHSEPRYFSSGLDFVDEYIKYTASMGQITGIVYSKNYLRIIIDRSRCNRFQVITNP